MENTLCRLRQGLEAKALALEKVEQELRSEKKAQSVAAAVAAARTSELEAAAAKALAAVSASGTSSAAREAEQERAFRDLQERWVKDVANMERQVRTQAHAPAADHGMC